MLSFWIHLDKAKTYRVATFLPMRPLIIYVGVDGGENTYLLNANAEKFLKLIAKSGLKLTKRI